MDIAAPGLQDFDYMEIDGSDYGFITTLGELDPNLNVTSVPEQIDHGQETAVPNLPDLSIGRAYAEDQNRITLTELSTVEPQSMESSIGKDNDSILEDLLSDFSTSGVSVSVGTVPDLPLLAPTLFPATVTLLKTAQPQNVQPCQKPSQTIHLMGGFHKDGFANEKQAQSSVQLLSQPADASTDSVPLIEPIKIKPAVQTPAFDLVSPAESADTRFTFASEDGESTTGSASVSQDREQEIQRKAAYIREVIEKCTGKPDDMSSKLKVHEVILVILLNSSYGDKSKDLQRILTFCDEQGREVSSEGSRHFKTLDTETMGLLWQKIKGNKKGNYDTFARAMRVRRERTEGFFEYLNAGKGKKKRIYRFGERSIEEMSRFKRTLRQVSRPQGCSY